MLQALDGKTDALTRHQRVDFWTIQSAEAQTHELLRDLARHVAGSDTVAVDHLRGRINGVRQALKLVTIDVPSDGFDPIPGGHTLAWAFDEKLKELESTLAESNGLRGNLALLESAEASFAPLLARLRQLAASLTHMRLELQDRDQTKVRRLIQLNRWLLLTVLGAAVLFIALLVNELRIAQRAEARARAERSRFQDFVEVASDWLFETDEQLHFKFVSGQIEGSTGRSAVQHIGQPIGDLFGPRESETIHPPVKAAIDGRHAFRDVVLRLGGPDRFVRLSGKPVWADSGAFLGYRGIGSDITSEVRREERVRFLAEHDALTGLYNRSYFMEELRERLAMAEKKAWPISVLILDLDGFKDINDTFGHDVGDALIISSAERLKRCLRSDDLIARLGGDEFAVTHRRSDGPAYSAEVLADRLLEALRAPMQVEGFEFVIGTSIGMAHAPQDGSVVEDIMKAADLALYAAKAEGRNRFIGYRPEMSETLKRKRQLETDLRKALEEEGLELYVQPQVDLRSERLTGGEALVRWRHPELGPIGPDVFIPIAEETGLILPLGRWVMETACREAKRHLQAFGSGIIAVNVSPAQFTHQDLVDEVASILDQTGLPAANLELEITEGLLMRDHQAAVRALDRLHELGVQLAIDDFGTGYSSLSYLKRFRVNKLKIDRAFVDDLNHSEDDFAIVQAIIMMSQALGFETLAEGVETAEQKERLLTLGCKQAQGYYYGKPRAVEAFFGSYQDQMRVHRDHACV